MASWYLVVFLIGCKLYIAYPMDQMILLKVLWLGHMSKSPTLKLAQSHVRISSEQVRTQPFQVLPSLQWTCIGFVPSHSATLSEKKA